jgi:hypothetical protein
VTRAPEASGQPKSSQSGDRNDLSNQKLRGVVAYLIRLTHCKSDSDKQRHELCSVNQISPVYTMVSLIIVGNIRMAPKSSYDGLNDLYVAYSAFVVHSFQNCKDFYAMLVLCAPAGQDEQCSRKSAKPQAICYP